MTRFAQGPSSNRGRDKNNYVPRFNAVRGLTHERDNIYVLKHGMAILLSYGVQGL